MADPAALSPAQLSLLRLSRVDGLGPVRLKQLLDRFGSADTALVASTTALQDCDGIGPKLAEAIVAARADRALDDELAQMARRGVKLLFCFDDDFPGGLRDLPAAPLVLSMRGSIEPVDKLAVAIVGSRRCTAYGKRMAEQLTRGLVARGVTIVSGLARGVDGAAHEAALKAGGRTIAVMASGLGNVYPPEHLDLADRVAGQGALVSEAPLDGEPIGGLFPQRNRIISGLSLGVVVIEASARSGALSTARHALDQNREVFAVPGRVGDPASEGTNDLIKQGACLVRSVDDILEQLGPVELRPASSEPLLADATAAPPPIQDPVQKQLWEALGTDDVDLETLLERTSLRASEANSALFMLEIKRLVKRLPGNRYVRA